MQDDDDIYDPNWQPPRMYTCIFYDCCLTKEGKADSEQIPGCNAQCIRFKPGKVELNKFELWAIMRLLAAVYERNPSMRRIFM